MVRTDLGGYGSANRYVREKLNKLRSTDITFSALYGFMLSEEQNVLAKKTDDYKIIRKTYAESRADTDANECAFGEKYSSVTESLRNKFRASPIVHVYVARFPFPTDNEKIFPTARAEEIDSCSNPEVKLEKYYVWKLLENALMRSLGLKLEKLDMRRSSCGKWECDGCCFSLSHSGNFVVVAVSGKPVGVDIEKSDEARFTAALAGKITTARESEEILNLDERTRGRALNVLWTKKEAVFKLSGEKSFHPKNIETSDYATVTKTFRCDEGQFLITVASDDAKYAVFRTGDNFEFIDFDIEKA